MKYIKLVNPGNNGSVVVADGQCSEHILENLANVLRVELCEGEVDVDPVVMVSDDAFPPDDLWISWEGYVNSSVRIFWRPDCLRYRFQLNFTTCSKEKKRIVMRRILALTLLREVKFGNSILCHGALLQFPDTGKGVVLIGRSGMGKTTASHRFESQGGMVLSDDKFFLTFTNDAFYAQPLPTWSRYFTSDISVSFAKTVPVHSLLILSRGNGDKIVRNEFMQWTLEMLNSFNLPLSVPRDWLAKTQVREYMERSMQYLPVLQKKFGIYQLCGDLHGNIYRELNLFLQCPFCDGTFTGN